MLVPGGPQRINHYPESDSMGSEETSASDIAEHGRDESLQFSHLSMKEAQSQWAQGHFKAAAASFHAALGFLEAVKPSLRDSAVRMRWRQCAVQLSSCYVLLGRHLSQPQSLHIHIFTFTLI